jgi:small subunit ribosomal protein S16
MLKMRFKRCGKKQQPNYKIVVMPSTSRRDGKEIEYLGFYNPLTKEIKLDIKNIVTCLNFGVKPTKTVKNLLIKAKVIESNK